MILLCPNCGNTLETKLIPSYGGTIVDHHCSWCGYSSLDGMTFSDRTEYRSNNTTTTGDKTYEVYRRKE